MGTVPSSRLVGEGPAGSQARERGQGHASPKVVSRSPKAQPLQASSVPARVVDPEDRARQVQAIVASDLALKLRVEPDQSRTSSPIHVLRAERVIV